MFRREAPGRLLTTAEEFPNVAIYAREGTGLRVVFAHLEDARPLFVLGNFLGGAAVVAVPLAALIAMLEWRIIPDYVPSGIPAVSLLVVLVFVVPILLGMLFNVRIGPPFYTYREIQLDPPRDEFRVYRNGRLETVRALSRLDTLTVEPHPKAELERQKNRERPGRYQKQHLLVGWFGEGGAEKVPLLGRWEYPVQKSLIEVLKAVQFAVVLCDTARRMGPQAPPLDSEGLEGEGGDDGEAVPVLRMPPRAGIKPPLD